MFPFLIAQEKKRLQALDFFGLTETHGIPSSNSVVLNKYQSSVQGVENHINVLCVPKTAGCQYLVNIVMVTILRIYSTFRPLLIKPFGENTFKGLE